MAEIIVGALIQVVFQKLGDEALKQIVRAKGVEFELNNLGNKLSMLQDLLNDASDKEISDRSVKNWLNTLHHLAYDIDDVLDSLATKAMHREFTSKKLGDEALKQIVRAQGIQSEIKNLDKKLSKIQDVLNDAADKETADKDVKQWLKTLKHLAYDIDDLLDGLATDAMHHELTDHHDSSGATTSKAHTSMNGEVLSLLSVKGRLISNHSDGTIKVT